VRGLGVWIFAVGLVWACAPSLPSVQEADVQRVEALRPGATRAGLAEGRRLYAQRCGSCHRLPDPGAHALEEWPSLVEWMRIRSHLDTAEGRQVTDWILSRRLVAGP